MCDWCKDNSQNWKSETFVPILVGFVIPANAIEKGMNTSFHYSYGLNFRICINKPLLYEKNNLKVFSKKGFISRKNKLINQIKFIIDLSLFKRNQFTKCSSKV